MSYYGEVEQNTNPISKYLSWKGGEKDGYYDFWNKETSSSEKYKLGRFVILKNPGLSFRGFSSKHNTNVNSTEVDMSESKTKDISVWAWTKPNKTTLIEGKYADIKEECKANGYPGHGCFVAYSIDNDEVVEFFHKGTSWVKINEALKEGKFNILEQGKPEAGKNGGTKFTLASFSNTGETPEGDLHETIMSKVKEVRAYFEAKGTSVGEVDLDDATELATDSELPFTPDDIDSDEMPF